MHRSNAIAAGLAGAAALFAASTPAAAEIYAANGGINFGGPFGTGNLEITDSADGTGLDFVFNRGALDTSELFNTAVIYLDTVAGGFTDTTSFNDRQDGIRRAISGAGFGDGDPTPETRADLFFSPGFGADFAIGFNAGFAGLWALDDVNNFTFVADLGLPAGSTSASASFPFSADYDDLGLSLGDTFEFVATYINSGNAFRSDEAIGDGIVPPNPGNDQFPGTPGGSTRTYTAARSYTTVPEPASLGLVAAGAALMLRRRGR